ncbi:hypothetical protein Btru_000176 [Bulinus truncatus]|nr:hypothetical protein Btru_000176 [Bulinus truncatus]
MTELPRFVRSASPARGADPKLAETLRLASSRGQLDLVGDCLARGAGLEPDRDGCNALHYAALGGHARVLLAFTPLMKAVSHRAYDAVLVLLEAGCNVNTQDEHGNTALHEACWNGFSKTAELLVQYNCDVCMTNKYGDTALHTASRYGHAGVARILISAKCKLSEQNKDGCNALHYAALGGHAECCKTLVSAGCDINQHDKIGFTPLMKAVSHGAYDAVLVLLEAGCNVNTQDEHGNTALHEACWNGFSKTAELLVQYNCDVCMTNKAGFTALHLASQNGHNESSRVLLYAGCNPDLKNNYGDTALHTASRYGHAGVARILISAKCKLSEQNKNGDTPLHIASALKRRKIAKILVESGIDVKVVNKQNETAIDVAKRKEYPEIILLISSYATDPQPSTHFSRGELNASLNKDQYFHSPVVERDVEQKLLKPEPKQEKENKRFFIFKKKKKDKEKSVTTSPPAQKKPEAHNLQPTKPAVHGFFSQYVPRDGVQLYRDLAGNIKQGPIGYAPVCQCGPSLKRLENTITDTKDSLYNYVDASHQILSQRIENLDMQTEKHARAAEALVNDRFLTEEYACRDRISSRLEEERLETKALLNQASDKMRDQLEYWLNDKLASYGHCLDHHHDDTALPPRNLFTDFVGRSNLVRSRSDETLSASDYSGKFRKKDFYASRQAAMQQIRGWDVPNVDSREKSRRREKNNNSTVMANRMTVQAQVHHSGDSDKVKIAGNSETYNPITTSATPTSPQEGNISTHPLQSSSRHSCIQKSQYGEVRSRSMDRAGSQHRVTFSKEPQVEYASKTPHRSHPSQTFIGSPTQLGVHSFTDQLHRQQHPPSHHSKSHSNFLVGCPPSTVVNSSEHEDTHSSQLTGQKNRNVLINKSYKESNDNVVVHNFHQSDGQYTKDVQFQDSGFSQMRTFSMDSNLNNNISPFYSRQHISRSHSSENTLETNNQSDFHSGYMTDSGIKTSYNGRFSQRNVNNYQSFNPSTPRYQRPDSSTSLLVSQKPQISSSTKYLSSDHDNVFIASSGVQDRSKDSLSAKNTNMSKSLDMAQLAGISRAESRSGTLRHYMSPMKECLQHNVLNSTAPSTPVSSTFNKEDSTCSSNQDSGYGSRNPYGRKVLETSGGTPCSSFCLERSSSGIPSNTGSPVTFSDVASNSFRSDCLTKSPWYGSENYTTVPPNHRQPTDNWSKSDADYRMNSSNSERQPTKPISSRIFLAANSSVYSRPPQSSTTPDATSQLSAYTEGYRHNREASGTDSGIQLTYPYQDSALQQMNSNFSKLTTNFKPSSSSPQLLKSNEIPEPQKSSSQTVKEFSKSHLLRSSTNMQQSNIQTHIQGWYQQKLMEAAQRLRQSESYNVNDQVSVDHIPDRQYINQSSGYNKTLLQATNMRNDLGSNNIYPMKSYSSQSVPAVDPPNRLNTRGTFYGQNNSPRGHVDSDLNRSHRSNSGYQSDSQTYSSPQILGQQSVYIHYDPTQGIDV